MSQFAHPTSDVSTGSWTTTPLWSKVDETPYSDTDYIQVVNKTADSCEFQLNSVVDPASSSGHIIRARVKKAGSGTVTCTAYLYEGTTLRATTALTLTTSYVTRTYTLSAAEADSITNYSDLHIRLTATCASSSRYVYCSWVEFEVPDEPATLLVIQDATHSHSANNAGLTQHNIIAIQGASHTHAADTIALIQHNILAITAASHAHAAENVVLVAHAPTTLLVVQDASHGHGADNITLTYHAAHYNLIIQDGAHSHGADNVSLVQHNTLSIADATHGHTSDNITLTYHAPSGVSLTIADASHTHLSDNVTLTAYPPAPVSLTIADATHGHYADNVTLTAHDLGGAVVLHIADATHVHMADNVVLIVHIAGVIGRYKKARSLGPSGVVLHESVVKARPVRVRVKRIW